MIRDSVSEIFWYRKNIRFGIGKKVSDSVLKKIGVEKSFDFGIVQILGIVTH